VLQASDETKEWPVDLFSMLHMANDSTLFRTIYTDNALPVFESKMIHQFTHRFGTYDTLAEGERSHMLPPMTPRRLADPTAKAKPCYYCDAAEVHHRLHEKTQHKWLVAFRDVTSVHLSRTAIFSFLPIVGAGHSVTLMAYQGDTPREMLCFVADMNSFAHDYCVRQKIAGFHLSGYILKQSPAVPRAIYGGNTGWDSGTLSEFLSRRAIELAYATEDLRSFAENCEHSEPPFRWDASRRSQIRGEIDAAYFHLYLGSPHAWSKNHERLTEMFPTPTDAIDYIMETFPIVKKKDVAKYGSYRTKERILAIYDEMAECIAKGTEWKSPLDPPPGDPRAAWTEEEMEMWRAGRGDALVEKYGLLDDAHDLEDSDPDQDAEAECPADAEAEAVD
jgi:hypothetical protein